MHLDEEDYALVWSTEANVLFCEGRLQLRDDC